MKLDLTEEQALIQRTARDYAERELAPRAAARDRDKTFPEAELRALAGLGMLGVAVPEEYGGAGAGVVAYSLAVQELARGDASVAVAVSVTNMVAELIARYGTEEQRRTHVPRVVGGEHLCASFALSEPEAGSDASALRARADWDGKVFRLSGTKQWVTSGDRSGLLVVWAVTDPPRTEGGRPLLSAFLVPGNAPGLTVARIEDKMGLRGSSTAQLVFDQVELPESALLGTRGDGFRLAMVALSGGRIGIASQAIGVARFAWEAARNYALERRSFGVPIVQHQAIGNMLADCATAIDAASLLTLRAAWAKERDLPFTGLAARAKLFATERASQICDQALQIHGGYGYTTDFPVERAYRDVRVTRIYEGTSEIQRIVIARELIKEMSSMTAPKQTERKIRILVAKPGLDGHDRGAKVVARALADAGYEVVYTGLHQTPEMIAAAAVQEAVDAVGLSIMSGAHMTLFPAVIAALQKEGAGDVLVFGGGIIPDEDMKPLADMGVARIFKPGASTREIIDWVEGTVRPRLEGGK